MSMHRLDLKLETYPAVLREVNRKMKKKRQELNSSQTQVCLKPESKENWDLSISRTKTPFRASSFGYLI
jgi:hypothetical protein